MNLFIDKIKITKKVNKNHDSILGYLSNRIELSESVQLTNTPWNNIVTIKSYELTFLTSPRLSIYRAKIEVVKIEETTTKIKVRISGNPIYVLFKYLGFIVFVFALIAYLLKQTDFLSLGFSTDSLMPATGPLLAFVLLNFVNRSNIIKGQEEILKLIDL